MGWINGYASWGGHVGTDFRTMKDALAAQVGQGGASGVFRCFQEGGPATPEGACPNVP